LYFGTGKAMFRVSEVNAMTQQKPLARTRIRLNGEPYETTAGTLSELLAEAGFGGTKVATALNGAFVPEGARPRHRIAPGDQVEIVSPRQGG
jgi:sulfur carrier protein